MGNAGQTTDRSWKRLIQSKRGTTALEFALVSVPFLLLIFSTFEVAFDIYTKAILDNSLVEAARAIETGNAQNALNGSDFINKYLCPMVNGLLTCSNLYVRVQRLSPTPSQDFYDFTTGMSPVSSGVLNLSKYASSSFCNSGPSQLLLISAVYVGPSIIGQLLPGGLAVSYNGGLVHATFSSVGTVTESYSAAAAAAGAAAPC